MNLSKKIKRYFEEYKKARDKSNRAYDKFMNAQRELIAKKKR